MIEADCCDLGDVLLRDSSESSSTPYVTYDIIRTDRLSINDQTAILRRQLADAGLGTDPDRSRLIWIELQSA